MEQLFIKEVKLDRERVPDFNRYPFNIPVISNLESIRFTKPITFLVGENGAGKSTLIEALAVSMGLSAEGGSRNMRYETMNTTSVLHEYCKIVQSGFRPIWKFFLRAESFYTMANDFEQYKISSWHQQSHGEAFLDIIEHWPAGGLYLLDEPESALSPKSQMQLLTILDQHAQHGSQFIIATHSPILLAYGNAEIKDVDHNLAPIAYRDTEVYQMYRAFLDSPERMQRYLFASPNE